MATAAPSSASSGVDERPRLLAVEVGEWPGLGGNVRLELDATRTVLVGKNGAGKSLLVEGLFQAARRARFPPFGSRAAPRIFRCDIARPDEPTLTYEYRMGPDEMEEDFDASGIDGPPRARVPSWYERCWLINGTELWKASDSKLVVRGGEEVIFPPGMGLLAARDVPEDVSAEANQVAERLAGFGMVSAGVPRSEGAYRREIIGRSVRSGATGLRQWVTPGTGYSNRVAELANSITSMWEHRRERYDEFVAVLRDLGLVQEVTVKIYEDPQARQGTGERSDFASVLFDGVNIGLLSDGTLRISEIVNQLLRPGVSCLLIEEPETAVHPGLLAKLLALMHSYSFDRQIVISTHSPQVVNWCEPTQLRLVAREGGVTQVHALGREDIERVTRYLDDHGTFADFVYERASE